MTEDIKLAQPKQITILSHDDVGEIMYANLEKRLALAKNVRREKDEIRCNIGGQEVVIIAPITTKNTDSLKEKIIQNNANRVATGFVFPQSVYQGAVIYPDGHYLKKFEGFNRLSEGLYEAYKRTINNLVELSMIERKILENFRENLTYFKPTDMTLRNNVKLVKEGIPELIVEYMLGIKSEGKVTGDQTLIDIGKTLKAEYGKGHSKKILVPGSRNRYVDISILKDRKERVRLKSIDQEMEDGEIKGQYTLEVKPLETPDYGKILIARVIPYLPPKPNIQGKLF